MFANPWKSFTAFQPKGFFIRGDAKATPTKWWNHLWLVLFGWTKVAVLRAADAPAEGWLIGYRDFTGKQLVRTTLIKVMDVRMLIGHEDCTFFAVTKEWKEISLECVIVQEKSVPSSAPLL